MMRSLYSGVAGLKTHQTRMDVIGNNIANVNTTAYKSQSMTFSDLMYQTTQSASGANAASGVGGVNARQIGLGAKTAAIKSAITTQGASQTTNNPFDLMITGSNFFVVSNGSQTMFTRDGSFYVDGVGNLCMQSTGYNVMGWLAETDATTGKTSIKQDTVQSLKVMAPEYQTYAPEETSMAQLAGIVDSNDTNITGKDGKLITLDFYDTLGYKYTAKFRMKAAGSGTETDTTTTPATTVQTTKFTLDLTSISDSKGEELLTVQDPTDSKKRIPDETAYKNAFPTATFSFNAETGKLLSVEGGSPKKTTPVADADKATDFRIGIGSLVPTDAANAPVLASLINNVKVDASSLVNFNNNGASTATCTRGDKDGDGSGRMLGEMSGINIQKDGMIYATYDNGMSRLLGQIATAEFSNPSGLSKEGDNLYAATQNSGDFDGIGVDITAGGGYMNSGVLEMSNVDLSSEFTEMITTQRGFQANSRIITVSDTLLEELTNLKR